MQNRTLSLLLATMFLPMGLAVFENAGVHASSLPTRAAKFVEEIAAACKRSGGALASRELQETEGAFITRTDITGDGSPDVIIDASRACVVKDEDGEEKFIPTEGFCGASGSCQVMAVTEAGIFEWSIEDWLAGSLADGRRIFAIQDNAASCNNQPRCTFVLIWNPTSRRFEKLATLSRPTKN